jgi:hypothetical protein
VYVQVKNKDKSMGIGGEIMDLSKLSTARKLELMKTFVRLDRPKTALKLKQTFHPSARKKQVFNLINPNASVGGGGFQSGEVSLSIFNQPGKPIGNKGSSI